MSVNHVLNILVLGDSHVYWLGAFGDSVGSMACFSNFSVSVQPCAVELLCIRGGSITSIRSPDVMYRVAAYKPDVVSLSVAGNDLDKRHCQPTLVIDGTAGPWSSAGCGLSAIASPKVAKLFLCRGQRSSTSRQRVVCRSLPTNERCVILEA